MHCPNCGIEASLNQNFCRSCGQSLEKVPQLLGEKLPVAESAELSDKHVESLKVRQRKIDHWLSIIGYGFTSLLTLSAFSGIIYLMVNKNLPLVPGILILLFMLGGSIAALLSIYSENLKKTLAKSGTLKSGQLLQTEMTTKLPIQVSPEELISVTEHTTKSLERYDTVGEIKRGDS